MARRQRKKDEEKSDIQPAVKETDPAISIVDDEEIVLNEDGKEVAEEEIAFTDGREFNPLPCQVTGVATVMACIETPEGIVALLGTKNPLRISRFLVQHIARVGEMIEVGANIMLIGDIKEEQIWTPARVLGRAIPLGDGKVAGAEIVTQFVDVSDFTIVSENAQPRLSVLLETMLTEYMGKVVNENRQQARRNVRGRRQRNSFEWENKRDSQNLRPNDRLGWASRTGDGFTIRTEFFNSDSFSQRNINVGTLIEMEVPPQWQRLNEDGIEFKNDRTGKTMMVKTGNGNNEKRYPVVTVGHRLRAVVQTRILNKQAGAGAFGDDSLFIEDFQDVDGNVAEHASRAIGYNRQ